MKKWFFFLCIMYFSNCEAQASESWYKLLRGNIDKYPITLYLYCLHHNYTGYYYYDSQQEPIYFNGSDSGSNKKILLTVSTSNNQDETFSFSFSGSSAAGTWQRNKHAALLLSLSEAKLPVSFTYTEVQDSVTLRKKLPGSPQATYQGTSVWPVGNTASDECIKTQIRRLFLDKQNSTNIHTVLQQYGNKFLAEYMATNKAVTDKELKDAASMYTYNLSGDLHVDYQSGKIVSLAFSISTYTGGAHGNYGTSHLSLDLVHNQVMKLTDVLTAAGIKQLRPLLEKNFRKMYHLQPADSLTNAGLFDNKIEPNKNFYVTGRGLIFSYNPYEIASYATGAIEIVVAFKDLQNYLQPAFISLLK